MASPIEKFRHQAKTGKTVTGPTLGVCSLVKDPGLLEIWAERWTVDTYRGLWRRSVSLC